MFSDTYTTCAAKQHAISMYPQWSSMFTKFDIIPLTIWHCILSAELIKMHYFWLLFLAILPTGIICQLQLTLVYYKRQLWLYFDGFSTLSWWIRL